MQPNADKCYNTTNSLDGNVNKNNKIDILYLIKATGIATLFMLIGAVIKKLRSETRTVIEIPKVGSDVSITGLCKEDILSARNKINELINNNKKTLKFTHFVSIPTNTDEIKKKCQ